MYNYKNLSFISFLLLSNILFAQEKTYKIEYEQSENGKTIPNRVITITTNSRQCSIVNSSTTERFFIDYSKRKVLKTGIIGNSKLVLITSFDSLSKAENFRLFVSQNKV